MIEWLGEWLKDIILIVLLASFVDLLLPNSEIQKYARIVLGLLIILVILSPIIEVFDSNYSLTKLINDFEENTYFDSNTSSIQSIDNIEQNGSEMYQQKILNESTIRIKKELSRLLNDKLKVQVNDLSVDAEVIDNAWQINKLIIYAEKTDYLGNNELIETSISENIVNINDVRITDVEVSSETQMTNTETNKDKENETIKEIKTIIYEEWDLPAEKIEVFLNYCTN